MNERTIQQWVRAGVLFGASPARQSPDLERLLLDTARVCPTDPRLFVLAVSWLVEYGSYIARHRLKELIRNELDAESRSVLGVLLDTAIDAGAVGQLRIALDECRPGESEEPLFAADRKDDVVREAVRESATSTSRRWKRLVQPFEPKRESLRPAKWILEHNPEYRDRALRKGDLRCSILETLNRDIQTANSESELARLCGASRTAVRHALDELEREGVDLRNRTRRNRRDQPIGLTA